MSQPSSRKQRSRIPNAHSRIGRVRNDYIPFTGNNRPSDRTCMPSIIASSSPEPTSHNRNEPSTEAVMRRVLPKEKLTDSTALRCPLRTRSAFPSAARQSLATLSLHPFDNIAIWGKCYALNKRGVAFKFEFQFSRRQIPNLGRIVIDRHIFYRARRGCKRSTVW